MRRMTWELASPMRTFGAELTADAVSDLVIVSVLED